MEFDAQVDPVKLVEGGKGKPMLDMSMGFTMGMGHDNLVEGVGSYSIALTVKLKGIAGKLDACSVVA